MVILSLVTWIRSGHGNTLKTNTKTAFYKFIVQFLSFSNHLLALHHWIHHWIDQANQRREAGEHMAMRLETRGLGACVFVYKCFADLSKVVLRVILQRFDDSSTTYPHPSTIPWQGLEISSRYARILLVILGAIFFIVKYVIINWLVGTLGNRTTL